MSESAIEQQLIERWNENFPGQDELGQDLLRRYAEPHRVYHGVAHLAQVLEQIDALAVAAHDLYLVRLAAWFHDAVYAIPVREVTNEEASARLAFRELGRCGLEQEDLNEVARLVRLTASHRPGPGDKNAELLCDADLSVLGGDEEAYSRYVEEIRAEYHQVPELDFVRGRLEIMSELAEERIFHTNKAFRSLQANATRNVQAECDLLESRLYELER